MTPADILVLLELEALLHRYKLVVALPLGDELEPNYQAYRAKGGLEDRLEWLNEGAALLRRLEDLRVEIEQVATEKDEMLRQHPWLATEDQ